MTTPAEIADAILAAAEPYESLVPSDVVESTLRPFGIISSEMERKISDILGSRNQYSIVLSIGPWVEANVVVSGEKKDRERRITILLRDVCECVLEHLPKAIEHATEDVDPRVLALLKSDT